MSLLSQHTVDKLDTMTFDGICVYRYMIDKLVPPDSPTSHINSASFNSSSISMETLPVILPNNDNHLADTISRGIGQCSILCVNLNLRRLINGEMVHTVTDPYLDTLDISSYGVLEILRNDMPYAVPVHTSNITFVENQDIIRTYGMTPPDLERLAAYISEVFFPTVEEMEGKKFPIRQRDFILSDLYYALSIRNAYICFYKEILKSISPQIIIYAHGSSSRICFLYEAARELGIPCAEIDHGLNAHTLRLSASTTHADKHLVYSELSKDISSKLNINNVIAIGKPGAIEAARLWQSTESKDILVSVISSTEETILDFAIELSRLLPSGFQVAYKRHPAELWDATRAERVKIEAPSLFVVDPRVNIHDLFSISHIVIGEESTSLVEALPYQHIKVLLKKRIGDTRFLELGELGFFNSLMANEEITEIIDASEAAEEILKYSPSENYRSNGEIYWKQDAAENFAKALKDVIRESASV